MKYLKTNTFLNVTWLGMVNLKKFSFNTNITNTAGGHLKKKLYLYIQIL